MVHTYIYEKREREKEREEGKESESESERASERERKRETERDTERKTEREGRRPCEGFAIGQSARVDPDHPDNPFMRNKPLRPRRLSSGRGFQVMSLVSFVRS